MKPATLIVVASALVSFGLNVSAAPPGGGHAMGGGPPGGMPSHADMDHSPERQSGAAAEGRNVSDLLADNAKLSSQIKDLTGTDAQKACTGFRNLGSCVAAAHVSKNLDIPFDTLRAKLTGTGAVSLGRAIHDLRPDADARNAEREATRQADADLNGRR